MRGSGTPSAAAGPGAASAVTTANRRAKASGPRARLRFTASPTYPFDAAMVTLPEAVRHRAAALFSLLPRRLQIELVRLAIEAHLDVQGVLLAPVKADALRDELSAPHLAGRDGEVLEDSGLEARDLLRERPALGRRCGRGRLGIDLPAERCAVAPEVVDIRLTELVVGRLRT